jgi:hypothetical protein
LSYNCFDFDEGELVASWQLWLLSGLQHLDLRITVSGAMEESMLLPGDNCDNSH